MANIYLPVPGDGTNNGGNGKMDQSLLDQFNGAMLTNLTREQTAATLYADDARRAAQRRVDEMSIQEALATQTATTSAVAKDAMQLQTAAGVPK